MHLPVLPLNRGFHTKVLLKSNKTKVEKGLHLSRLSVIQMDGKH